jgi:hypothetical protein
VEVDVWDYLGGAGSWGGRVGGLVFGFGLLGRFAGVERASGRGGDQRGGMWVRRKIREWR